MANLLAAGTEAAHALPFPPSVFGIGALLVFGLLLAVTYAFRSVSNKH